MIVEAVVFLRRVAEISRMVFVELVIETTVVARFKEMVWEITCAGSAPIG